jgi:arsenate reductase (thioredoxin)
MTQPSHSVLFLCTANSARSILAEAALNAAGEGRWRAFSAGSQPRGTVNPLALQCLQMQGYAIDGLASKSWDDFTGPAAPDIDIVITLCDSAAAESCPVFPGAGLRAHWGLPDPAAVEGSDAERIEAFRDTLRRIGNRIAELQELSFATMDRDARQQALQQIGQLVD